MSLISKILNHKERWQEEEMRIKLAHEGIFSSMLSSRRRAGSRKSKSPKKMNFHNESVEVQSKSTYFLQLFIIFYNF